MNTLINAIVPALRLAIPFGIIALVFCIIRKYDRKKTTYWSLFSAYIGAVIGETILSGQRYASRSIQLIPFESVITGLFLGRHTPILQMALNMVLFIPMGVFLYLGKRKPMVSVLIGLGSSLVIEIVEYITKTGVFDIDDLIMNTLGTVIGYFIAKLVFGRRKREID